MIQLRSRPVALALLALWTAIVWKLCTSHITTFGPRYPWSPWLWNLGHAPLLGTWATLLALSLRPGRVPGPGAPAPGRAWLLAALGGVLFGVLIEWRQEYVPGRSASVYDVLTDAVGAFGVPWALSTGALLTRRALVVFAVGSVAALLATYA